jgi:hypothetical protein
MSVYHHVVLYPLCACLLIGCGAASAPAPDEWTKAVYNETTGKLEQIVSDRNRDGRPETWAYMDGAIVRRIEIDRTGDGHPDRWEHYARMAEAVDPARSPDGRTIIERAEEANGPTGAVTRRETYALGVIADVEEDTDLDGRIDKWEHYRTGVLVEVALDLQGRGRADRRLIYLPNGDVSRIEEDPDGDGTFVDVSADGSGPSPRTASVPDIPASPAAVAPR